MPDLTLEQVREAGWYERLAQLGSRMFDACPDLSRALVWGIVHPRLRHDTFVRVCMWRDGHVEKIAVDGTVVRSGPPGCNCPYCREA